jgi:hypothetical protein
MVLLGGGVKRLGTYFTISRCCGGMESWLGSQPMGQYDNIISSYLDKLAKLRVQLESLKRVAAGYNGQRLVRAKIQRIEYEIHDLVGAINRCRERSEKSVAIRTRQNINEQVLHYEPAPSENKAKADALK